MSRFRVLHLITHFAVGGATEPTIATCRFLDPERFDAVILAGETEANQETMFSQAREAGVSVQVLPSLRRPIRPAAEWRAYHDLIARMERERWDILHTHGSKAGILGRLAAARAGVPVIIHNVHGWGHHGHMSPLARRALVAAERRAARVTDRFLVDADANRDKGLADGIGRRDQYETVYNGIDLARFRAVAADPDALRREWGIPAGAPVVGTVSRMAPQKAPEDFVRMAAQIHARRPDAHFVFVGGGPLQGQVEAQVHQAGLGSVVHLLGYRTDVAELLRLFDVFVLTSLWEGLPRVFAQAMCAGLPIVATRVDGAPEAIDEGENGFLVAPGDPGMQAGRVLRLLDSPEQRRRMGERGARMVASKFCEREMVRRIEAIYLECAASKGLALPPARAAVCAAAR